ncbi:PhzA/PhzB family protein [Paramicrobacterium fandaimingii]|uniref:PhzA/PhzB family protein n=1 Tax=Paramicrobacterium fandaimingii TaxID=2708079 RepID=UPI001421DAE0|nr:PhzA/PhzB family protein [Microbacterium fandaimingii]
MQHSVVGTRENLDKVRDFFRRKHVNDRWDLFSDNVLIRHPFGGRVSSRSVWYGKHEVGLLERMIQHEFRSITYHDLDIHECSDGANFWVLARTREDSISSNGKPYYQRFVHHFTFEEGLIARWDEYFDALALRSLRTGEKPVEFGNLRELRPEVETASVGSEESREENLSVVRQFLDGDPYHPDTRLPHWAPDAIKELAWTPPSWPVTSSFSGEELLGETRNGSAVFGKCIHRDVELYPTLDPCVFFATSRMDNAATFRGELYPQSFVLVLRVERGKVKILREYFDTALIERWGPTLD